MRVVTNRATLAQRVVFENHGPRLLTVTWRAAFVRAGHGQTALGFEDVPAMRIVALHTIHPAFEDRMMLGQMKLAFNVNVALKTSGGLLARIEDESGSATGLDVFAAGPVAGFAAQSAGQATPARKSAPMRTGRKFRDEAGMAIRAGLVAHQVRRVCSEGR